MNITPSVLFARGLRCKSDTPPPTPTRSQRYNLFRARTNEAPVNNHPWKWTQK